MIVEGVTSIRGRIKGSEFIVDEGSPCHICGAQATGWRYDDMGNWNTIPASRPVCDDHSRVQMIRVSTIRASTEESIVLLPEQYQSLRAAVKSLADLVLELTEDNRVGGNCPWCCSATGEAHEDDCPTVISAEAIAVTEAVRE